MDPNNYEFTRWIQITMNLQDGSKYLLIYKMDPNIYEFTRWIQISINLQDGFKYL